MELGKKGIEANACRVSETSFYIIVVILTLVLIANELLLSITDWFIYKEVWSFYGCRAQFEA